MTVYRLKTPISKNEIEKLEILDILYITGSIITARDSAYKRALNFIKNDKKLPVNFNISIIYHCGPLVKKTKNGWNVISAGPTTSMRMETVEPDFIQNLKPSIIIGKGGVGKKTIEAMKKNKVVYGLATGGTGVLYSNTIKRIKKVEWLDLGLPEALWIFEVKNFGPIIISIDCYGNNLFKIIQDKVSENKEKIFKNIKKNIFFNI
jgi:fumarate hydratase subunit beta